jgi:hypothetical protein
MSEHTRRTRALNRIHRDAARSLLVSIHDLLWEATDDQGTSTDDGWSPDPEREHATLEEIMRLLDEEIARLGREPL